MRIGLFIDTYLPMIDGVVRVVENYAKCLSGYADVIVFCPDCGPFPKDSLPYQIRQCRALRSHGSDYSVPLPRLDRRFMRAVEESNLDIVHIHSPYTVGRVGWWYARRHGIPLIGTLHSQYKQDIEKGVSFPPFVNIAMRYTMAALNACDECWAVNGEIERLYRDEYSLTAPSRVHPNATSHRPVADEDAACLRVNARFGISSEEHVFLFVGRLNLIKNLDFLLNALALVKQKGQSFRMLFVGTGVDEPILRTMTEKLGLSDNVIFCGRFEGPDDLQEIYARATLFLFPSLYDANSLVQIEAACQSTPTLFLRGAKTAAGIVDGENGFLSDQTTEAYADRIIQILSDPEALARVGKNAHRTLYFTWETVVRSAYDSYERLIEKKRNGIEPDVPSHINDAGQK